MPRERVVALGVFDGVHVGHASLMERTVLRARQQGRSPAVLSFDRHPDDLVKGVHVPLINTAEDREIILRSRFGIEDVLLTRFDEQMMHMPWEAFIDSYLIERLRAAHVVCGYDFRFGNKGEGNPQRLAKRCAEQGIGCDIMPMVELHGVRVSSTLIRTLLEEGEMEQANEYLGHPHILSGTVVKGKQLGRTIGTPTANLLIPDGIVVPAFGVYVSKVTLPDGTEKPAVTNIGVRPTVEDSNQVTVEPWILDYDGDLYGQTLRVEFLHHIRGERKFASLQELQAEIFRNAEETRAYLQTEDGSARS